MSQDPWSWYGRMVESDRNMQQQGMQNLMGGLTSAVGSIAGAYAENSAMKAKADSYDKIGEIIGSTMFKDNPQAQTALAELKGEKDPYKRAIGWEALMGVGGWLSNAMMADATRTSREGMQDKSLQQQMIMPTIRAGAQNEADVNAGRQTYSPPPALGSVVPPLSTAGFGSITQGMPGAMGGMPATTRTRQTAVRPGGR